MASKELNRHALQMLARRKEPYVIISPPVVDRHDEKKEEVESGPTASTDKVQKPSRDLALARVPAVGVKLGGGKGGKGISLPPEIDLTISFSHKFRFQSGANAVVNAVSYADMCNFYQVGTGANKLQGIFSAVRLRSVTVWPSLSSSTTDTVALEWSAAGAFFKDQLKNKTLPEGQTNTSAVVFKPPKNTVCSFWHYSTSDIIFYITASSGSVVDVHLDCCLSGAFAPPTSVTTVGAVVVGNAYYGYMDGVSTHIWAPVVNTSQF